MVVRDWNDLATVLANFVRERLTAVVRGSMMIPVPADQGVFVVVFGNRRGEADVAEPVEEVRQRLRGGPFQELGFGKTKEGSNWALLLHAELRPYDTAVGQRFQKEILRAFIDDAMEASVGENELAGRLEQLVGP